MTAAERIAAQYGVSVRTVYNAAKFADAVDVVTAYFGPEIREGILSGKIKATQKDVIRVARAIREGRL